MSELKKINLNNHEYTFVCYDTDNRDGYTQHAEMFIDDMRSEIGTDRIYNRGWYMYKYQNAMLSAINKAMNNHESAIERRFRNVNNITRMTAKKREELNAEIDSNVFIKEMRELKEEVASHVH